MPAPCARLAAGQRTLPHHQRTQLRQRPAPSVTAARAPALAAPAGPPLPQPELRRGLKDKYSCYLSGDHTGGPPGPRDSGRARRPSSLRRAVQVRAQPAALRRAAAAAGRLLLRSSALPAPRRVNPSRTSSSTRGCTQAALAHLSPKAGTRAALYPDTRLSQAPTQHVHKHFPKGHSAHFHKNTWPPSTERCAPPSHLVAAHHALKQVMPAGTPGSAPGLLIPLPVGLVDVRDLRHERVVWVGVRQQGADGQQHLRRARQPLELPPGPAAGWP